MLINEPPLQVLPTLAKLIGLNEAVVLQQIHYWMTNPKIGVAKNGTKWIYNSYQEWGSNFPFWSNKTIRRIIAALETKKLLLSCQLRKHARDMTKFYSVNYDAINALLK